MDNAQIESLVKKIIHAISEESYSRSGIRISEDSLAAWDSLHQMKTFIALEEEFGIQFAPSEIVPPKSAGHLAKLVKEKLEIASR